MKVQVDRGDDRRLWGRLLRISIVMLVVQAWASFFYFVHPWAGVVAVIVVIVVGVVFLTRAMVQEERKRYGPDWPRKPKA